MFYKLSRHSKLHNMLRIIMNNVLWRMPVSLKYGIGHLSRKIRFPYKLIEEGDVVIQIGAPWDLLKAGRSRTIHFSKLVGRTGKVIVFEADPNNVVNLKKFKTKYSLDNIEVIPLGAWNKKTKLRFLINDNHPASNLVEEVFDNSRSDLGNFRSVIIDVDSIDNILMKYDIKNIKLLSITSNGSEQEILEGAQGFKDIVSYISIIGDPKMFPKIKEYPFSMFSEDDRGLLYKRT